MIRRVDLKNIKKMGRRGLSLEERKGAFEMSMSTIIIIVLSVTFLILGLVLLKNIFGGATQSIDDINSQLGKEVQKIFADETKKIVVNLNDKTAKVHAGTSNFNFWISAKTVYGNNIEKRADIQYKIELDKNSDCYAKLGPVLIEKWFTNDKVSSSTEEYNEIREWQGDTGWARITLSVPSGTILCTQTVLIDFIDNTNVEGTAATKESIGGTSFNIQVLREGIF